MRWCFALLLGTGFALCIAPRVEAQRPSSSGPETAAQPRPTFQASGMHGTTAPSGYAAGVSEEDTDRARALISESSGMATVNCESLNGLIAQGKEHPNNVQLLVALGQSYQANGMQQRALAALQKAHRLAPDDRAASYGLAEAYNVAGSPKAALQLLNPLARAGDAHALRLEGDANGSLGETEKAIASYQSSITADGTAENTILCGESILHLRPESAEPLFAAAVKRMPDEAHLWADLGASQIALGQQNRAASTLLHAATLDPDAPLPIELLAGLHQLDTDNSRAVLKRIQAYVVAHPESARAHYSYALALSQRSSDSSTQYASEICRELMRALSLDPKLQAAQLLLGLTEARSGDAAAAAHTLEQVVQTDPKDREAHYRLALAYRNLGEHDKEAEQMKEFLVLKRDHVDGTDFGMKDAAATTPCLAPKVP